MSRWATLAEIAGVSFTGCRVEILDGPEFATIYRGSVEWGLDGTPHTQVVNIGVKGIQFGVQMVSAESSKLNTLKTNIQSAQAALTPFEVELTDELYTIAVLAEVDYTQRWFSHGLSSEGWTQNVVLRFISKGPIV